MRLKFFLLSLILISIAILPFRANAASPEGILINAVPENPAPNENVSVTLNSYANDLDSVLITWFANGKNTLSGIGKKSFLVNAPNAGSEITVIAKISLPDGVIEKKIIIRSAVMVLLWQADDSYVPPFYKGKALPSLDSEIKVIALPEIRKNGILIDPKSMIYSWKLNYNNDQENSGYGKNSFVYNSDYLEDTNNVSVTASTLDQKYSANGNMNIGATNPKILFYKNDANLGTIWELALSNGHKIQSDEIIEAAPYFVSPKDIRVPTFVWNWSINNNLVSILGPRKNLISLKAQTGVSGTSKIKLEISNQDKIFENATKEINVKF